MKYWLPLYTQEKVKRALPHLENKRQQSVNRVSTECQRLLVFHHGYSQRNVAIIVYIYRFDCFCTLKGSRILSGSSVNEISGYCPRGCGRNIPYISAYKGCHILVYGYLGSSATNITEHARPKIVDAPLMLIYKMG